MTAVVVAVAVLLVVIALTYLIRFQLAVREFPIIENRTLFRRAPDDRAERLRRRFLVASGGVVAWSWVYILTLR